MARAATAVMLAALMCSAASGFLVQHPSSLGPRHVQRPAATAAETTAGGFRGSSRVPAGKRGRGPAMSSTAEVVDVVGGDDPASAGGEFDVKTNLLKQIDLSSSRRMRSVGAMGVPQHYRCVAVSSGRSVPLYHPISRRIFSTRLIV